MLPLPSVTRPPYREATSSSTNKYPSSSIPLASPSSFGGPACSARSSFSAVWGGTGAGGSHPFPSPYFHRAFRCAQIDWEFAVAQMIYLCVSPRKVYEYAEYRKQTKQTLARDDPGVVIILVLLMLGTSVSYSIALRVSIFSIYFFLSIIFPILIYFITGFVFSSIGYLVGKHHTRLDVYMKRQRSRGRGAGGGNRSQQYHNQSQYNHHLYSHPLGSSSFPPPSSSPAVLSKLSSNDSPSISGTDPSTTDQSPLEWTYCFDIHTNGSVVAFLLCSVLQFLLLPLLLPLASSFVSAIISNSIYCIAGVYYFYTASIGYSKFSFIPNAVIFLYPAAVIILFLILFTLFRINMTKIYISVFIKMFNR